MANATDEQPSETGSSVPSIDHGLRHRLREITRTLGEDISVSASGKSWKQLSRYIAGGEPPLGVVVGLAHAANVHINWLATGEGARDSSARVPQIETRTKPERTQMPQPQNLIDAGDRSMVLLPKLDIEASAGCGMIVGEEDVSEMVAFDSAWLRARHITPHAAKIVTARGDSMEPTIRSGDILIVDTAIGVAVDSGVYVMAYNGLLLVKRLFLLANGNLLISSDNKIAGRDEEIPAPEVAHLHIAGRVMWYGRSI